MQRDVKSFHPLGFGVDLNLPKTSMNFSNCERNKRLIAAGVQPPKVTCTGTTVAAFIFKEGVILGSDKRSNTGKLIVNDDLTKIHFLCENIYCGAAGVAADAVALVRYAASNLELHRMDSRRQVPVVIAVTNIKRALFERQGK